jgi:hypothetical protein
MTIERELLRRISSHSGTTMDTHFIYEIQKLLTQPEQEPLSDDVIADLWGDKYAGKTFMVRNFARAIEKAHGIGGDDD